MPKKSSLPAVTSDIPRDLRLFVDRVREAIGNAATRGDVVRVVSRVTGRTPPGGGGEIVDPPTPPWDGWDDDDWEKWFDETDWWDESDRPPDVGALIDAIEKDLANSPIVQYLAERITRIGIPTQWVTEVSKVLDAKVAALDKRVKALNEQAAALREELIGTITDLAEGGTDVTIAGKSGYTSMRALKVSQDLTQAAVLQVNDVSATSGSANARALSGLRAVVLDPETGLEKAHGEIARLDEVVVTGEDSHVSQLESLTGRVGTSEAGIKSLQEVVVTGTSSHASQLTSLTGRVGTTESSISTLQEVVVTGTSSHASQLTSLTGRVGTAESSISTLQETVVTGESSHASQLTSLTGRVGTAESTITKLDEIVVGKDDAAVTSGVSLVAQVNEAKGAITQLNTITADSTSANVQHLLGLQARVDDAESSIVDLSQAMVGYCTIGGKVNTSIPNRAKCEEAGGTWQAKPLAEVVKQISVTSGGKTLSFEQLMQASVGADGNAKGLWGVKVDNNGHVSGFGLTSEVINGNPTSTFAIRASKFAVVDPTATDASGAPVTKTPFTVLATPVYEADGVTVKIPKGVYMDAAFIKNASIETAKIKDAAIESAKIKALAVTDAHIAEATISSAKIRNLEVNKLTAGKLAVNTYIRSYLFDSGSTGGAPKGWSLSTDAEGNGAFAVYNSGSALVLNKDYLKLTLGSAEFVIHSGSGGNKTTPFKVGTDGEVYINSTVIEDATITSAKIASLAAGKLTAGTINTDDITVASTIKSKDYVAGRAGWKIDGTLVELNNATFRGKILGGAATAYGTGTGLFAGMDGTTYKFRLGTPSGARLEWDGDELKVYRGGQTTPVLSTGPSSSAFVISSDAFKITNSTGTLTPFRIDGSTVYIDKLKLKSGNVPSGLIVGASGSWSSSSAPVPADVPMLAPGNLIVIVTVNCYTKANGQQSTVWVTPNMGVKGQGPSQSGPAAGQTLPANHDGNVCTAHMFNVSAAGTYGASAAISLSGTGHTIGSITINAIWAIK